MSVSTRGDAWFVRRRKRGSYQIMPCRVQGWALLIGYVLFTFAITPVLRPPTPVHLTIWLILIAAATILFSVAVWRTSISED